MTPRSAACSAIDDPALASHNDGMAGRFSEPPPPGGPDFDERLWELLARADRIMGMPRPERERVAETNAAIRETQRKVPLITGAIAAAVGRFEATADLVEAHFRRLRGVPAPTAAARAAQGPDARLATIEARIKRLERTLARLRRRVAEAADEADEWERRAMLAVELGDDLTAREALRHRRANGLEALALAREADTGVLVLAEMREAARQLRALHEAAERDAEGVRTRS